VLAVLLSSVLTRVTVAAMALARTFHDLEDGRVGDFDWYRSRWYVQEPLQWRFLMADRSDPDL
jgi:hypothetical protein